MSTYVVTKFHCPHLFKFESTYHSFVLWFLFYVTAFPLVMLVTDKLNTRLSTTLKTTCVNCYMVELLGKMNNRYKMLTPRAMENK